MTRTATYVTFLAMALVVIAGFLYIYFIDESEVQKRKNTPAAEALIIDAEDQSFTDKDGNPVSINENFGNIIVATSWASWCPQCIEGVVALGGVASEYRDRDVVVLAVNRGEDKYTAERYLATVTVPDTIEIILDPADHYFKASEGYAMPETIIYNEDGEVVLHQRGNVNTDEIKAKLQELTE